MDQTPLFRCSHCLAGLPPSDPLHPLYKRHIPDIGGPYIPHRELQKLLTVISTFDMLEIPSTLSSTMVWGV